MKGKLYGVGVGPGDPKLMTVKAIETISNCPVIAIPGAVKEETTSYKIAAQIVKGIDEKECLFFTMPMTKDKAVLDANYKQAALQIIEQLEKGKDVSFLTLGDPTVYSTYIYIHRIVSESGYETEIISGIPSFCAASARLNDSLAERAQQLHIIPSSYAIEEALELPGTKVLMKAGKKMPYVKEILRQKNDTVVMVENCSMSEEHIYYGADEIPEEAGYYSLIIVKES